MSAALLRSVDLVLTAGTIRTARPLAACNPLDLDCFGDSWYHAILYGVATLLWWSVRMCLIVARGLESLQAWLITNVLGTAFTNILAVLKPWVLMAAALAVLIIIGSQALIGFVQHSWVDVRRAAWAGLTSLAIFSLGATGLASIYQFHAYGAQVLQYIGLGSVQAAPAADSIAFYTTTTTTDAMPPTVSLYGAAAAPCPGTDLRRTIVDPATGISTVAPDQFYLNDYAALYVYANAVDIHCPPATFFLPEAFQNVFFPNFGDTFTTQEAYERDTDLVYAWFGIARLVVGYVLGWGSILERMLHLVFVLALTAALFGYAASRLIAFFVPFAGLERQQRDALVGVFAYSWMSAFWIGLFLGLTHLAARTNALVAGPMAVLTVGVVLVRLWFARRPLATAVTAASAVAGGLPTAFLNAAAGGAKAVTSLMGDGVLLAAAAATGGTSAVLMGAARHIGAKAGSSEVGQAAGRHLGRYAADQVQNRADDAARDLDDVQDRNELGWWERGVYTGAGDPAHDQRANERVRELLKQRRERAHDRAMTRLDTARRRRRWTTADQAHIDERNLRP